MEREGVEKSIGSRVAGLSEVAQDSRGRREQHEVVQLLRESMQVPRSGYLGSQHARPVIGRQFRDSMILEDHGLVEHPPKRRQVPANMFENAGEFGFDSDVRR